jgi:adenosylcobinamide kinase/adenosylcobinamide-phosphate guanylyltransferase
MKQKMIFITGGARSGKSSFALNEASKLKGQKAYIATAEALDDEMKLRIEKHKRDRGSDWDAYEEPLNISALLSKIGNKYDAVVLDCLTLWLSNIMHKTESPEEEIKGLTDALQSSEKSLVIYIVSNEIGMGIVPDNELAREFRDLAGFLNQEIAGLADEVYLVTSGIPIKIKG